MDLDGVSFLFDKSELILLLRLLGCENILLPLQGEEIDAEAALERLREDQLISGSWEALAVDQVIAFLLLAMDSAAFRLYAFGGGFAAVFRTGFASIVLRKHGEQWLIMPLQFFSEARISMLNSLKRLQAPCILTVCSRDSVKTLHFKTTKAIIETAKELLIDEEERMRNGDHNC